MPLPQSNSVACRICLPFVCSINVAEHGGHFPGEGVEVEAPIPEPFPTRRRLPDPLCPPLRVQVGDRRQPGPAQTLEVWPTAQQRLSESVAAGGSPQVRKRPCR